MGPGHLKNKMEEEVEGAHNCNLLTATSKEEELQRIGPLWPQAGKAAVAFITRQNFALETGKLVNVIGFDYFLLPLGPSPLGSLCSPSLGAPLWRLFSSGPGR